MRVSIVAQGANERSTRQHRLFTAQGHTCQLYFQEQLSEREVTGTTMSPAALLEQEHVRDSALFLFHFADEVYPLLETMKQLQQGLVVLDLRGATPTGGRLSTMPTSVSSLTRRRSAP